MSEFAKTLWNCNPHRVWKTVLLIFFYLFHIFITFNTYYTGLFINTVLYSNRTQANLCLFKKTTSKTNTEVLY